MSNIHSTAIVNPKAKIGTNVTIGPYAVVGEDVQIGDATQIGSHVVVTGKTTIGNHCQIFSGAVLGEQPQDLSFDPKKTSYCKIGDRTIIREHVTIHRGTEENSATEVGNDCFIMAGAHVAHNCKVHDQVIMANAVLLGGYVEIEERCFLGGGGVYQQFARVGKCTICSGNIAVNLDIPPFMMAIGYRPWVRGINLLGLKRAGYEKEAIVTLKKCYKELYRSGQSFSKALKKIEKEMATPEVLYLVEFCRKGTKYPICSRGKMDSATLM